MKLRSRINLYTIVMFIILLILVNGAIYLTFSRMILNSELERTTAEAAKTAEGINQKDDATIDIADVLRAYMPVVNGMLQIIKADGSAGAGSIDPNQRQLKGSPTVFYEYEKRKIIEYEGKPYTFVSIPIITSKGEIANLQMTEGLEATTQILRTLKIVLIAVTLLASIPVLFSSRLLSNFITKPISSMIQTMFEIRKSGKYKQIALPKQSKDELYQMGETFNEMIAQLKRNYEKQEQFVSNASHELKTPLTVIESYASLLKRRGLQQPELFQESVEAIHSEAIRMKELTQQLLLLARQEDQWNVEMKFVHLATLGEESIRSFKAAFNRRIEMKVEQDVVVKVDEQKLKQIFYILMENAHKYSEAPIIVIVRREADKGLIEVKDEGVGIPNEELSKVFDRFYRVDKARTRKTGGFGLGLSLAKEMAKAIQADLTLESVEGGGTTARISLKIDKTH
ncbi:sensor histidine kinase [Lederbergia lenta]|uniref:histidine kinase n=1 Tax=Lederbergia lenta TaxID=1467 RepID=A0A2X4WVH6_LEDLE|nr:HAMP domain-containing sensor histidine kinase [Lederbergia lenta]MCM3113015.1 HAMP domain-containing histidine kinase [Lederbergia lenta]MEC2322741.1 HAMP domain-containing sensor histidine kinase [Lederbergia lenta]SQI61700.1 two-component sensor histidine kinase [Lederbergia lenta]